MKTYCYLPLILILPLVISCKEEQKTIKAKKLTITESIYASGNIESENQYQVFSSINGIVSKVLIEEGQILKKGTPLFQISNNQSKIQLESAKLTSENSSISNNENKLKELKLNLNTAKLKWRNDSLLYERKNSLFKKNIITSLELENAELNFQNSHSNYQTSLLQYQDLIKQIKYNYIISSNNAKQIFLNNKEYTIKSEINGEVFSILKKQGEFTTTQNTLALIGSKNIFLLKLQVDEYDIVKIKKGQLAKISLDSYKGKSFNAVISKIYPIMNERSKTFLVDAKFIDSPPKLYPNLSVEANIIVSEIKKAITIPRQCLVKKNTVLLKNGDERKVKVGLKNYEYIQILSGLNENDEIILSNEN